MAISRREMQKELEAISDLQSKGEYKICPCCGTLQPVALNKVSEVSGILSIYICWECSLEESMGNPRRLFEWACMEHIKETPRNDLAEPECEGSKCRV
jgi:hypothetical protein